MNSYNKEVDDAREFIFHYLYDIAGFTNGTI